MWVLSFLPEWVFHLMLCIGLLGTVGGWVLKKFPTLSAHSPLIQITGIVLLIVSIWYEGGIAKDAEYRLKIAELSQKASEAEAKAAEANAQIEYIYVNKVQKIKDVQIVIKERVIKDASAIDKNCKVSPEAISLLNASAKNELPGDKK